MSRPIMKLCYTCTNAMFNYLKDKNLDNLLSELRRAENIAKEDFGTDEAHLWFKFGTKDTMATTIAEIERDLQLPAAHGNYQFMIENMELVTKDTNPDNELEVYFS